MYLYASDASVSWHTGVNRPRPRHPPVSDLEHHSQHALVRWYSCLRAALGMLQVFSSFHIKESVLSFRIVSCQISLKLPPTSFNSFLRGPKSPHQDGTPLTLGLPLLAPLVLSSNAQSAHTLLISMTLVTVCASCVFPYKWEDHGLFTESPEHPEQWLAVQKLS